MGKDMSGNRKTALGQSTFLSRLRHDQKGNVLAIVAASIIPLVGMIGGGVDLTRAYMAQARLSQACDSAVLAGRKVMRDADVDGGDGEGEVQSGTPTDREIDSFIDYNFPDGKFDTGPISRSASVDNEGEMTISLATTMPTQLLPIVGIDTIPIAAECSARRSGVNVDVVLVVDVTGSMSTALGSTTRIGALKTATLSFLDALDDLRVQLAVSGTRVRTAIVPYSTTVNVGLDLYADDSNNLDLAASKYYSMEKLPRKCVIGNSYCGTGSSSNNNKWESTSTTTGNVTLDLTEFASRGAAAATYNYPYNWKGCIEMRQTIQSINSSTDLEEIPAGAWDITDVAAGVGGAPKWQPYFQVADYNSSQGQYGPPTSGAATGDNTLKKITAESERTTRVPYRLTTGRNLGPSLQYTQATGTTVTSKGPNYGCNSRVKLLSEDTRADLESYVNGLTVAGGTYHDVGMYWGLALISPQAPFENPDTYLAPDATGEPRDVKRYIVFMTDGTIEPFSTYSAWGREANPSAAGNHTVSSATSTNLTNAHRRRFRLLCEEAKRTGIEISTVVFSNGVGTEDQDSLKACATSEDQYYKTETASGLEQAFLKIARNIGYLRVSR